MNRQTLAVVIGSVALLIVIGVVLYGGAEQTPQTNANPTKKVGEATKRKAPAKAKGAKGGKAGPKATRVPKAKLITQTPVEADRAQAPAGAPNVVMLVASTIRADQTAMYGGPAETMPFLAEKAAGGVIFDDALSVGVWPKHSDSAIVTGKNPHSLSILEPQAKVNMAAMDESETTLAERMQAAGYWTVGLSANHHMNKRFGLAQGFDTHHNSQPNSFMMEQRIPGKELAKRAVAFIDDRGADSKDRPVYLQLSVIDSHKPFRIPPEEFKPFEGEDHKIAPYRATLKRVDDALEKLVSGLAELGIDESNTLFVVVADHGEGLDMPKHHKRQHGLSLYHSSVKIPLIMWGQGAASGKRIEGLANQTDVAPTVLAMAGLKAEGMDGMDLSASVKTGAATQRTSSYADTFYLGAHRASIWTTTHQCQKDFGSENIDKDSFMDACYDRKADPTFTTAVDKPELMKKLEDEHSQRMTQLEL